MKRYECSVCGYIYDPAAGDPDSGIAPGTSFEDLPENWSMIILALDTLPKAAKAARSSSSVKL